MSLIWSSIRESQLVEAYKYLRSKGVEPLLAKGWAAARLYPESGLRPYGDLDLLVKPEHHSMALDALDSPQAPECAVELHCQFRELTDRSVSDLFARSQSVVLGDTEIRILGAEDHLRLLCLHALHHGLWRPVWLVDIAVVLDRMHSEIDWQMCLRGDRWFTDGVKCVLRLSHELLGVSEAQLPAVCRDSRLPRWFLPATLRQWGATGHYMSGRGMDEYLQDFSGLIGALYSRWPNPIRSTFTMRAAFDNSRRWPFQLAECCRRGLGFLGRLPRLIKANRSIQNAHTAVAPSDQTTRPETTV